MPKQLSTNVTSLGLRAVDDPMMARLVIGGKTMGFVLVKEPQTRAEAAAMQVMIPLEHLADAEPSADTLERTNNPADTALSFSCRQQPSSGLQYRMKSPYSAVELFGTTMRLRRATT